MNAQRPNRTASILICLLVTLALCCLPSPARAAITTTGNVTPADPATWDEDTFAYIGLNGSGTMDITSGSDVEDRSGYIGFSHSSTGEVTVDGTGSTWTTRIDFVVGTNGSGMLNITGGGAVSDSFGYIGLYPGSTGEVTVDGTGSTWTNSYHPFVGYDGNGVLNITGGGAVNSDGGYIGTSSGSTGGVTVDGIGSMWTNSGDLSVGLNGSGVLNITDSGLVSVAGTLTIDYNEDGDGFINMATGGMLALDGDADDSLAAFLGLIDGTDAIRYWDYPLGNWDDITNATLDEDYTLSYLAEGDLAGYTMLTVLEPVLLEGDANCDGVVSADDYGSVQVNFGEIGVDGIHGDANLDGVVSADDYGSVQLHFGSIAGMGSVPIPEPATLSLLAIGGLVMLRRKK